MKKAHIHFIIIGFTLSLFTLGCKKYPEDDYLLTFRSTFNRIKGSKKIDYAYSPVDSTNILSIYEDNFGPFYIYFSDIKAVSEPVEKFYAYFINANTNELICFTFWSIYEKKSKFQLTMNFIYDGPNPCFTDSAYMILPTITINGPILKCDKNELILSHAKLTSYAP